MARFRYGEESLRIDDRTMFHLEIAINAVLAVGDSFSFTWREDPSTGRGRTSVWMSRSSSFRIRYDGVELGPINPAWVRVLMVQAGRREGLEILPEPIAPSGDTRRQH